MVVVVYWMKGRPKDAEKFSTWAEARAFMKALSLCESCDGYSIDKEASNYEIVDG